MSKLILIFTLFIISLNVNSQALDSHGPDTFLVKSSIIIKQPIEQVFEFAGNTANDDLWRSEVHIIHADGEFEVGTRYIEDAKLGIHKHYMTEVELKVLTPPLEATYVTVAENPFFLKSSRFFEVIDNERTRFTYKVTIEKAMIGDIVGIQVPVFIIKPTYEKRMRKYLKKLKNLME